MEIYSNKQLACHYNRANGYNSNPDFLIKYAKQSMAESLSFIKKELPNLVSLDKANNLDIKLAANSLDGITSLLQLHFKNNIALELEIVLSKLKPDGVFLANFFGGRTLTELRQAIGYAETKLFGGSSPRVCPTVTVQTAGDSLKKMSFGLPVACNEEILVEYDDIYHLISHLRKTGLTNPMHSQSRSLRFSKKLFAEANAYYKDNFADNSSGNNKIIATYELITISGWKGSSKQQKPLSRGSGKVNLNNVL